MKNQSKVLEDPNSMWKVLYDSDGNLVIPEGEQLEGDEAYTENNGQKV